MDTPFYLPGLLFLLISAIWLAVHVLCTPSHDPREPPLVTSRVPFIGHILGLLRHGTRYYQMTRYGTSSEAQRDVNKLTMLSCYLVPDAGYQSTR